MARSSIVAALRAGAPERVERLLEVGHGLAVRGARRSPCRRPAGAYSTARSQRSARRAWWASRSTCSSRRSAYSRSIASTIRAWSARAALLEQAAVRDLVGQRVLERVLQLREEADRRTATRRPGAATGPPEARPPARSAMARSSANGTSLPITAAVWSSRFSSGGSRSMRAASTAWTVAGTRISSTGRVSRYAPRSPTSAPVSTRLRTLSSRKNGLPSVRSISSACSGWTRRVVPQAGVEQLLGALPARAGRSEAGCSSSCCPRRGCTPGGS